MSESTTINNSITNRLSSASAAIPLFAAMLLVLGAVNLLDFYLSVPYMQKVSGFKYLDMQGFYNAEEAYAFLAAFGEEGRKLQFHLLYTIDVLLPVTAGLGAFSMISFLYRNTRMSNLRYVAVLAAVLDFLENAGIAVLLVNWPVRMEGVAGLTGLATAVKSGLYNAAIGFILIGILYRVFAVIRGSHE